MEIFDALVASLKEAGWEPIKLASEVGVTEAAAKKWVDPEIRATPSGDTLLKIVKVLPGFGKRIGLQGAAVA